MPDKKLTDNEIKKALEFLRGTEIANFIIENTLDLINRLQAENKRLKEVNKKLLTDFNGLSGVIKRAKTQAYKEFAEKLKFIMYPNVKLDYKDIDNLLKEMVGDTDA